MGETIAIPLDVEYHWPDADKSVASAPKTVYAQKGIVVRVQVPEEIWAGESRPIFATLNGKYNDGAAKCGDVPWTYDIVWQFAEPVWEEEGTGEDITYTPRPPETADEYIPSTILTGSHRLKHDTSPLYVGDMTSESWGLVYVRAVITGVDVTNGEVTQCAGNETITSAWVEVYCIEELTVRSSETGEEIGGVSLYLPDDGTDRGAPHFVYHDALYALGMSLPDGLTEEVDTMVTRWHNNTIYEWESVELTETGAETNVFSYNEGGLEISVTLDEGAEVTAENDAFGATVYRSDQVDPARRTFFEETDETTCTFESSIFGAQIVLVDGLASDEADILQVMLFSSTSSESYTFIAIEDGNNTKRFVSQDGLWFVDFPPAWTPTANIDAAVVSVFGPATAEPQELRVVETGNETDVLVTMEYIDSEDTDYPAPSDTTFHFVEVKRWPAVCGDHRTVYARSGDVLSELLAVFEPAGTYKSGRLMFIPEDYEKPVLQGEGDFEVVLKDLDYEDRVSLLDHLPPQAQIPGESKDLYFVYFAAPPGVEDEGAMAFVEEALKKEPQFDSEVKGVQDYGHDLLASGIPARDEAGMGQFFWEDFQKQLGAKLGHGSYFDQLMTTDEFAVFLVWRARHAQLTPVILLNCHSTARFITLVSPSDDTVLRTVPPQRVAQIIRAASPHKKRPREGVDQDRGMRIHALILAGCNVGKSEGDLLGDFRGATGAFGCYGPNEPAAKLWMFAMQTWLYSHRVVGEFRYLNEPPMSLSESREQFNTQLIKAYKEEGVDTGYGPLEMLSRWTDDVDAKLMHSENPGEDWRDRNLDWIDLQHTSKKGVWD